ncbi:hypothetical protein ACS0TY_026148 [Phlomoides rotata]
MMDLNERFRGWYRLVAFWILNLQIWAEIKVIYDKTTRRSRGFGFVTMSTDSTRDLEEMQNVSRVERIEHNFCNKLWDSKFVGFCLFLVCQTSDNAYTSWSWI